MVGQEALGIHSMDEVVALLAKTNAFIGKISLLEIYRLGASQVR